MRRLLIAIAIIAIAVAVGYFLRELVIEAQGEQGARSSALYAGVPLDAKLLPLDKAALDAAYHAQLLLLFSTWLKDQAGDPTRINNGLRIARRAYHEALTSIEEREKALNDRK